MVGGDSWPKPAGLSQKPGKKGNSAVVKIVAMCRQTGQFAEQSQFAARKAWSRNNSRCPARPPKKRAGAVKPSVTVSACLAMAPPRATQDLADQLTSPGRQSSPQSHWREDFTSEGAMHLHIKVPCTLEDSFRCVLVCLLLPDGGGSGAASFDSLNIRPRHQNDFTGESK